jgi:hypothetical protein
MSSRLRLRSPVVATDRIRHIPSVLNWRRWFIWSTNSLISRHSVHGRCTINEERLGALSRRGHWASYYPRESARANSDRSGWFTTSRLGSNSSLNLLSTLINELEKLFDFICLIKQLVFLSWHLYLVYMHFFNFCFIALLFLLKLIPFSP